MNPWFLTGLTDAEGCFLINIWKNDKYNTGWCVTPYFKLGLHERDIIILEQIKTYFNKGTIYKHGTKTFLYSVQSVKDLAIIIDHFDKYPLISQKWGNYVLFKKAVNLINKKEHITKEGLHKIVSIKASMNLGLSDELKVYFPNIATEDIPSVLDHKIKDPNWLVGFTQGEGCFYIQIFKSKTAKLGESVKLKFNLTQHIRDEKLFKSLIECLGCGRIYIHEKAVALEVSKFSDLTGKLIPLFQKYPLKETKLLDYLDFIKVIELMKNKDHLTVNGLDKIRKIKAGMNKGRKFS